MTSPPGIRRFRLLLPIFPIVILASAAAPASERPWPLLITINLASSFGEYRAGHLHAGLDIRTYGEEGVACAAVGDGYVSRLRAASDGYGKAIYLTLHSGETAVYAHLAEFSPVLERALYEAQQEAGTYRVDLDFDPDRFPAREGDVLGYSGRTGASAPHLHFEFRDRDQNPVNPLSHGWRLADARSPEIRGVVWIPLGSEARIEGRCQANEQTLKKTGPHTFAARETLVVTGPVGLGANIVDRLNGTSGRLAPYRVELTVDGVELSAIEMESFTYAHTGEVDLAYDMERVRGRGDHYLLLFHRPGETLWNRRFRNGGIIDPTRLEALVGGRRKQHTLVVRAMDHTGNVSIASIPFRVAPRPGHAGPSPRSGSRAPTLEIPGCYFFGDLMSVRAGALSRPDLRRLAARQHGRVSSAPGPSGVGDRLAFSVGALGERTPVMTLAAGDPGDSARVLAVRRGEALYARFGALGVGVSFGPQSLFADAFVYVARGPLVDASAVSPELKPAVSPPVRLGPLSLVLRRTLRLMFPMETESTGREGVYRLDKKKNEWKYAGSEARGDTLYADVREPGVYAVFSDIQAPRVGPALVRARRSYATGKATPEIVVGIVDDGSGVDPENTAVYVGGKKTIARWDGFVDRMYVLLRDGAPTDSSRVTVVAVDRAGNSSTRQSVLHFARTPALNSGGNRDAR